MPLGVVNDSEFEAELDNSVKKPELNNESAVISGEVIDYSKGRGNGNLEVPDSLRKIIGETSAIDGRQEAVELARHFGIGSSSVSAYANGSTSTASYDKRPNLSFINQKKERITKKAIRKLAKALDSITDDKLTDAKPQDLSGIAKDMSAIVKNMEPEKEKDGPKGNGPTFIFYTPTLKREDQFEIVHAKE
jgi:hypothetical protein